MNWTEVNNKLETSVKFVLTSEALNFIKNVSNLADAENHHPEIIFLYRTVTLKLQTHDAGNVVTQKDRDLAKMVTNLL